VISCGSYVGNDTSGVTVNLGYEPQWLLIKNATTGNSNAGWYINDNMRGLPVPPSLSLTRLQANTSGAEETSASSSGVPQITATGFNLSPNGSTGYNNSGDTYIYIAIRRGPMKVPTTGTSVFSPITTTGDPSNVSVGFPTDWVIHNNRAGSQHWVTSRLTGGTQYTATNSTAAEASFAPDSDKYDLQNNFTAAPFYGGANQVTYFTRRAPGFFDEVCYTGTGANRTVAHNLTVVPELMIVKQRTVGGEMWCVYVSSLGPSNSLWLNDTLSVRAFGSSYWNSTAPTASVFTVGPSSQAVNASGTNYVAYLFATCPGVSKVGSYTGTGTTQTINCGFTAGSRFVLIKRTDSTGDWYVWDSARGIVAGNDPYLLLNSTAAEVTNTDYIDTAATGFEISSTAPAAINASGGTFLFLAVA
jgi:hypothetical protein